MQGRDLKVYTAIESVHIVEDLKHFVASKLSDITGTTIALVKDIGTLGHIHRLHNWETYTIYSNTKFKGKPDYRSGGYTFIPITEIIGNKLLTLEILTDLYEVNLIDGEIAILTDKAILKVSITEDEDILINLVKFLNSDNNSNQSSSVYIRKVKSENGEESYTLDDADAYTLNNYEAFTKSFLTHIATHRVYSDYQQKIYINSMVIEVKLGSILEHLLKRTNTES